MKKYLAQFLCLISLLGYTGTAYAVEAIELQISRLGDVDLSCGALSQEALLMRDIITTTQGIQEDTEMKGHGITAAGALGSLLVGTATGGVGIAAAGFLLNHVNEEKTEEAVDVQDIAQQRRALMMGIFNAKGCMGPIDHVLQDGLKETPGHIIQVADVEPAAGEAHGAKKAQQKPHYNQ